MGYNFYETYDFLNSLYEDAELLESTSENTRFKFLSTIEDLYSVLRTRTLWAKNGLTKNEADVNCINLKKETGYNWDYISLTNNKDFKVAKELLRPFGIELDLNKLTSDVEKQNCYLKDYRRFDVTKNPGKDRYADLYLGAVIKKRTGSYSFVLQGQWLPRNISEETYNKLLEWFKKNSADQLVHFNFTHTNKGEQVSDPLIKDKGEKKSKYNCFDFIDWPTSTATIVKKELKDGRVVETCNNVNFINKEAQFCFTKAIRDVAEIWTVSLNRNIGLTTGFDYVRHTYCTTKTNPIASPESGVSFALDKSTYDILKEKLNEDEFRIYIKEDQVFRYSKDSLVKVYLPSIYNTVPAAGFTKTPVSCALEEVFFNYDNTANLTDDIMRKIAYKAKILNEVEVNSIIRLYKYLKQNNFNYTFFDNMNELIMSKLKHYRHTKDIWVNDWEDTNLTKPTQKTFSSDNLDLTRYKTSKSRLNSVFGLPQGNEKNASNYSIITLYDKNNNPSLLYKDFTPNGSKDKIGCARLQVRGIILGQDEDDNWYINLIKKGDRFDELPGGSFDKLPSSESGLAEIARNKLEKETGINFKASDLKLLNDIYYAYEPKDSYMDKLVKQAGEDWLWQYAVDWMFLIKLEEKIDITKNKILSDGKSSWYLVDYILKQPGFLNRYVNIRNVIKDAIK